MAVPHTWTGAASASWSNPNNWSPVGIPDGDLLAFPQDGAHTAMINDLPGTTPVNGMTFFADYSLAGNPLLLSANVSFGNSGAFTCNTDLVLSGGNVVFNDGRYHGAIDVNGQHLIVQGSRAMDGAINGTGSIVYTTSDTIRLPGGGSFAGSLTANYFEASGSRPGMNLDTVTLYGSGTVGTVNTSAIILGTDADPYAVLHTKSLTIRDGYGIKLNASGASSSVQVTGSVNISGVHLGLSMPAGPPPVGQTFTIIDNDGADAINGTFRDLPEGTSFGVGGALVSISYHGGDGNDVVLTTLSAAKTWNGSASALWSDPANWSGHAVPQPGENLVFPSGASHTAMINDLPSGTVVGPLAFFANYSLSGNPLTLDGDVNFNTFELAFTCSADLKLAKDVTLGGAYHHAYHGTIDVNGKTLTIVTMGSVFDGPIMGSGSIIVFTDSARFLGGGSFKGTIYGSVEVSGSMPNANIQKQGSINVVAGSGTFGALTASRLSVGNEFDAPHSTGVLHTKSLRVDESLGVDLNPAGVSDSIQVNGSVNITGASLYLTSLGSINFRQPFTIIDNDGTDAIVGTFNGLPEGSKYILGAVTFRVTYAGGDGNDVVLAYSYDSTSDLTQNAAMTATGEPATFTVAVSPSMSDTTGVVVFSDGATTLGTVPLIDGVAKMTTSALAVGTHSIVATYSGGDGLFGSTSAPLSHVVQAGQTGTTLSVNHTPITFGEASSFEVAVKAVSPAAGTPSGSVTLRSNGTVIGTATLANGAATISGIALAAGQHSLVVSYDGSTSFSASASAPLSLSVAKAATAITAHLSRDPVSAGEDASIVVTVSAQTPAPPNGIVSITEGSHVLAQQALANGSATIVIHGLEAGEHDLVAAFAGDSNFSASAAALMQHVSAPAIFAGDATIAEGDSGSATARVTLHLSAASSQPVRVAWRTVDGSATSGEDFAAASGVAEFASGETAHEIAIEIFGDTKAESDESFRVQLSDSSGATIDRGSATIVIKNDDATFKQVTLAYSGALSLDLYLPVTGPQPYPVVIWVPGFISYDADTSNVPAIRETLRGYAVAVVRYRTPAVAHFPAQIDDLKSAVRFLRANASQYALDAQHVGVWGNGAGAHLAALLGTAGDFTAPEGDIPFLSNVQAVVDWNGASQLTSLNADSSSCQAIDHDAATSPESLLLGCALQSCAGSAIDASPLTYVRASDAPFLLMHAGNDCYIPTAQSQKLYTALSSAGVDATIHIYDSVAHVDPFWSSADAFAVVDAFLDAKLKVHPSRARGVRH